MFYVYVIKDIHGVCKVGMSQNVAKRMKSLQTGHPIGFRLVRTFPFESKAHARYIERSIHLMYANHKLRGEWFNKRMLPLFLAQLDKCGSIELLIQKHEVPGMVSHARAAPKKPKHEIFIPNEKYPLPNDLH